MGKALEGLVDEGAEVPAVEIFVGGFAGGVVAAGQNLRYVVDVEAIEVGDDVLGELGQEGEVVACVDY